MSEPEFVKIKTRIDLSETIQLVICQDDEKLNYFFLFRTDSSFSIAGKAIANMAQIEDLLMCKIDTDEFFAFYYLGDSYAGVDAYPKEGKIMLQHSDCLRNHDVSLKLPEPRPELVKRLKRDQQLIKINTLLHALADGHVLHKGKTITEHLTQSSIDSMSGNPYRDNTEKKLADIIENPELWEVSSIVNNSPW